MNAETNVTPQQRIKQIDDKIGLLKLKINEDVDTLEDHDDLQKLRVEKAAIIESRGAEAKRIKEGIASLGLSLTEIYTIDELVKITGLVDPKVKKAKASSADNSTRASDSAITLIKVKGTGARNPGYSYNQGRIYEPANPRNKNSNNQKPFQTMSPKLVKIAGSIDSLKAYISEENKEEATAYLATPEGIKELEAIVAFAANQKLKIGELPKA